MEFVISNLSSINKHTRNLIENRMSYYSVSGRILMNLQFGIAARGNETLQASETLQTLMKYYKLQHQKFGIAAKGNGTRCNISNLALGQWNALQHQQKSAERNFGRKIESFRPVVDTLVKGHFSWDIFTRIASWLSSPKWLCRKVSIYDDSNGELERVDFQFDIYSLPESEFV